MGICSIQLTLQFNEVMDGQKHAPESSFKPVIFADRCKQTRRNYKIQFIAIVSV